MKKTVFLVTSQIKSFIQTYNNQLKNAYKDVKDNENYYLVLLNEDLKANLKDDKKFVDDYINLAEEFDLPFTFFPYYGAFNKVLIKASGGIPHPVFEVTIENKGNKVVNIIHQIAPGCLVLNLNKLKKIDFKFDTNYPTLFYLQDLVEKCYRAKLWISNCWYIDRLNSWEDLKSNPLEVKFGINGKNFQDEQKKYFETNKDCKFKEAPQFIEDMKKWVKGEDVAVEIDDNNKIVVKKPEINLSIPNDLVKKAGSEVIEVKPEDTATTIKINLTNANVPNLSLGTNSKALDIVNAAVKEDKKAE